MSDKKNITRVTAKTQTVDENQAKIIIGVIVGAIVLVIIMTIANLGSKPNTADTESTNSSLNAGEEETESKDLAKRVESQFLSAWGVSSLSELRHMEDMPAESLVPYITGFEDVSSGTVRVFVQTDLSKSEAEQLGRNVLTMTGMEIKELNTVVVRGTDGIDVNYFRSSVPGLSD